MRPRKVPRPPRALAVLFRERQRRIARRAAAQVRAEGGVSVGRSPRRSGGGGSAETEALVGKKAPDFSLTDPVSGKVGSLVKDYVAMAKPIVLDFYQSF